MAGSFETLWHVLVLLSRWLGNGERLVNARLRAALALGKLRDPLAIRPLIGTLADRGCISVFDVDGSFTVRDNAAHALAEIGAASVKPLLCALGHQDAWVRTGAAKALGLIADPGTDRALSAALHDDDQSVRREAMAGLANIPTPIAVQALIGMLDSRDESERRKAIQALNRIGDPQAAEPLTLALERDKAFSVRMDAAEALDVFPGEIVTAALVRALKDEVDAVRMKALGSLAQLGEIDAIATGLKSPHPDVSHIASRILADTDWEPEDEITRAYFLVGTGQWGQATAMGKIAVDALAAALPDWEAAQALGEIGDKRAVEPLIEHLGSPMEATQHAVIDALVKLGDRRAIEPLTEMMAMCGPRCRKWIAEALEQLGDPTAIPGLIRFLLQAPNNEEAMHALVSFGTAGIDPLVEALGAEHRSVIEDAVRANQWRKIHKLLYYRKFPLG